MSYPSFHNFIKLLRSLLKHRQAWLCEESIFLADLCLTYGTLAELSDRDKKTLFLAAHFKNLGALYLEDQCLQKEYSDHSLAIEQMEAFFRESTKLARVAGLDEVAEVLEQYPQRAIPQNNLARIFQVLNAWVSCRQRRGWRSPMSDKEALVILKQRAEMEWSDPKIVFHFIEHLCRYSARPERRLACTINGFQVPPEVPEVRDYSFDTLEDQFQEQVEAAG